MAQKYRMSPMDASFIYIDSDIATNQVAGMAIGDGPISREVLLKSTWQKLERCPHLCKTPALVPFRVGHPTWEFIPDLTPEDYVFEHILEPPGTEDQLQKLVAELFKIPIKPGQPQWRIHIINGLEGGRSCTLAVVHHCIADGVGASNLISTFFDERPEPEFPSAIPVEPKPVPGPAWRFAHALFDNLVAGLKFVPVAPFVAFWVVRGLLTHRFWRAFKTVREYRNAPSIRFPFNRPLSGKQGFAWTSFELHEMNAIREKLGGTVNDVLLAAVAGAADKYAAKHGIDTNGKFFKMQIPVNMRRKNQNGELGNIVALMYACVPFGIADPAQRIKAISDYTQKVKEQKVSKGLGFTIRCLQTLMTPPGMAFAASRFARPRKMSANPKPPIFNLQITNVPWEHGALYSGGQRVHRLYPLLHMLPNVGMGVCAATHDGRLNVTLAADPETAPDYQDMVRFLEEAYAEIRGAAGIEAEAGAMSQRIANA